MATFPVVHGHARARKKSPEYNAWHDMKQRCFNPRHPQYKNYGARDIGVCTTWVKSFPAFLAYMGLRPSKDHSLDRRDNDGDYRPGNCRWALRVEQGRNRRTSVFVKFRGRRLTLTEWSRRFGIPAGTVMDQFRKGMSIARIAKRAEERRRI